MIRRLAFFSIVCQLLVGAAAADGPYDIAKEAYIVRYNDVFHPVVGRRGMVSTQSDLATRIGIDILRQGGNAFDAAVAVGFALAVTLPRAGNLGGGGFMVMYDAKTGQPTTLDYRETAPSGVTAEDFLDAELAKDPASRFRWPAIGVPGTVAGLHAAWSRYGSMPWKELLKPAIGLARDGMPVNHDLAELLSAKREWLQANDASRIEFYKPNGGTYAPGDIMRRPALANTLGIIAKKGPKAFYRGEIAARIVADMARHGGHIDREDLARYRAIYRQPIRGSYRGYDVVAMPPPSSGGIALIQALNILETFPLSAWGYSAESLHVLAETMKLVFADRGNYLADPAFFPVPSARLIDKDYARSRAAGIDPDRATPSSAIEGGLAPGFESPSTTHYSIVDSAGNAVSNTYTLSSSFGSGLTIAETGILMNNQIHTFSVRAGVAGAKGFIASEANRIEDHKRPVSSQSPTLILKDGKPYLVLGSPGGSRIITTVLQLIVNVIDFDMNIAEATNQRRIHHQWLPDVLEVEPGFSQDSFAVLREKGQNVKVTFTMGSTQSIHVADDYVFGASDPRRPNALTLAADRESAGLDLSEKGRPDP